MAMSGQNFLLIIVIISIQTFLLHAKSLRIAKRQQSSVTHHLKLKVTSTHSTKRTANSSCSPDGNQLEYYNQIYNSSSSISSFNGNTMYYTLRALQVEQNRSESTTTAAEDNTAIVTITDQSRFTPAGMDTANKAVCARVLQELDAVAISISNTALCGWDYVCDYKADRFPNYLFKARCTTPRCNGNCNHENITHNRCLSHGIHVTVLDMRGNCGEWVWGQEFLQITCTCTLSSDVMMNA